MGTILQMTKRGNRFEGGFAAEEDDRLKEIIKGMKEGSDELLKTDKKIRKILDAEPEQGRRITARIMRWLPIPQVLHGLLPSPLLKLMAEDRDALEFMERELRKNVDRLEEALDQLSHISLQKEAELKDLLADIASAKEKNLNARELQEYMAESSGITISESIAKMLDDEFSVLTDEEKEMRKQSLLKNLEQNAEGYGALMRLLGSAVIAGLRNLHYGMTQYYAYVNYYKPFIVLRDSAGVMTDMSRANFTAKDALCLTAERSVQAIKVVLKGLELASEYAIASPDTRQFLDAKADEIMGQLEELRQIELEQFSVKEIGEQPPRALAEGAREELPEFVTTETKEKIAVAAAGQRKS